MYEMLPGRRPPDFPPGLPSDAVVAYAFLQAKVQFKMPYFDSEEPVDFRDASGSTTKIRTFGVRHKDRSSKFELRTQMSVLFVGKRGPSSGFEPAEFAVDLCRRCNPVQVVFARVNPGETLATTLDDLQRKIDQGPPSSHKSGNLEHNDILLVPDMHWRIAHDFESLMKGTIENRAMAGFPMVVARQDLHFRLDRSGANLESQSRHIALCAPLVLKPSGPFLVYMKKRRAARPFFVMWVANAELLRRHWKS